MGFTATGKSDMQTLAGWMKLLGEPNRLRILNLLMGGEQCNCEMGDKLDMAPNLISHHLSVLQKAGLVDMRRDIDDGRWIHYSINRQGLERLNSQFGVFFDPTRLSAEASSCAPGASFVPLDYLLLRSR